jgi:hypothetical protein
MGITDAWDWRGGVAVGYGTVKEHGGGRSGNPPAFTLRLVSFMEAFAGRRPSRAELLTGMPRSSTRRYSLIAIEAALRRGGGRQADQPWMIDRNWISRGASGDFVCKISPDMLEYITNRMDFGMSENPLHSIHAHDRVSIRAVLVHDGEDPSAALAAAGIADPIALRVVLGDDPHTFGGMLGDGRTPNLTAVLETEYEDDSGSAHPSPPGKASSQPDAAPRRDPVSAMLPAASGMQPLQPVRLLGDAGQDNGARTGRFGAGSRGNPPSPGSSLQVDAIVNGGGRTGFASAGNDPVDKVDPSGSTTEGNLNAASDDATNQGVVEQPPNGQRGPHASQSSQTDTVGPPGGGGVDAYVGNDPINRTDPAGLQGQTADHANSLVASETSGPKSDDSGTRKPDAPVPVVLSNGLVVQNPSIGAPLLQPSGVSLA